jgi:protocatechuate 3,4-dioxygenase beta subunit
MPGNLSCLKGGRIMSRFSRLPLFLIAVLLVLFLAGCSSGGGSAGGPAAGGGATGNTIKGTAGTDAEGPLTVTVEGTDLSAVTGAGGAFEIPDVPPGRHTVRLMNADGSLACYLNFNSEAGGGTIDVGNLPLIPCGKISGLVTESASGRPIAGARISLNPLIFPEEGSSNAYRPTFLAALSDREGSYELKGVPPGSYQIIASRDGFEQCEKTVEVQEGSTTPCDFQLTASGQNEGKLRGKVSFSAPDGSILPMPGAVVTLVPALAPVACKDEDLLITSMPPPPACMTITDWDGTYMIAGITPGTYRAEAMSRGFITDVREVGITAGGETTADFILRTSLVEVSGVVTDSATGQPLEGAFISLELPIVPALAEVAAQAASAVEMPDASLDPAPPAAASAPEAPAAALDPAPPAAASAPVPYTRPEMFMTVSGSDGKFRILLEEGTHRLFCWKRGYERMTREITVSSSGAAADFSLARLIIPSTGSISGKVTEKENGLPIPGALITTWARPIMARSPLPDETMPGMGRLVALSDENGAYELRNVPAGEHRLCAFKLGWYWPEILMATVVEGETTSADFELESMVFPTPTIEPPSPSASPGSDFMIPDASAVP